MPLVKEWLASLGLSEYADRFAEHRIDFSTLRDLTDQDLKGTSNNDDFFVRSIAGAAGR
jgi:SAM (Sterile alpha motif) domain-containing protein